MCYKEQTTGSARILLAEAFVIQCRDNGLTGTGSCNDQIAIIATNLTLCLQLIQDLLLIGLGHDIHGVDFRIGAVNILLGSQCPGKTFLLIL